MNKMLFKQTSAFAILLFLGACGGKGVSEYHEEKRDKVIDGTALMVSIDDNLPPIHSFAVPILAGDTLIIQDFKSTDLLYTAYDIYNDSTIGRFGKFGNGPGEMGNPFLAFYNKYDRTLYTGNNNSGKLVGFHLPEAVSDSTYDAVDKISMNFYNGILYPHVLNDSTVLCTIYDNFSSRVSLLSRLNLNTGEITVTDSVASDEKARFGIAVSEKDNLIYTADKQRDLIRILNLDGEVQSIIYGPEYDENINDNNSFFTVSEICGKKVASVYTGLDHGADRDKIIITDLDGRYIATLKFDAIVWGMAYHDKTGRLYLTTKGEPQIGYIEIDKIRD